MGALAKQVSQIDSVKGVVTRALAHFDGQKLSREMVDKLSAAADLAFSDRLLFDKFRLWNEEQDDETLLFHIQRYFEKRDKKPLAAHERDVSNRREEIETRIKDSVRERQKKIFAERITQLAIGRDLLTNEQLGAFLNVSAEQARKYKSGENKPQLTTLKQISDRFGVAVEFLVGLSDRT